MIDVATGVVIGFLCGMVIGALFAVMRDNYYKRQLKKVTAYMDALRSNLAVATNKIKRLEKAGVHEDLEMESIDAGIIDGIEYVLKEKLSKTEY